MHLSKQHFIVFVIFLLTISTCKVCKANNDVPIVIDGIADLRTVNFTQSNIDLKGNWGFYWKQLVNPSSASNTSTYTAFPEIWNNKKIEGESNASIGFATYTVTILLPTKRPALAIYLPDTYSAYTLFINGNQFASNGIVDSLPNKYQPHWESFTLNLPSNSDTLVLVLQMANFSHDKGGPYKDITIGRSAVMFVEKEKTIAADFLLAGCLLMGGLFFLGLFIFGTKDKATLYFSLFCLTYWYRFVGSGAYSLHSIFPTLPWSVTVRLEYFSLFVSILLFLQYIRNLYPKDFYKPLMLLATAICSIVAILPLITPPLFFTKIINPFLVVMFLCIILITITFFKAYIRNRIAAGYALNSILVLMIVQCILNLEYFGFIIPSRVVIFTGYIIFFFLQSLILSFRFAYELRTAKNEAEQGLKSKSEFLSTMSHEIRTPLNSVIGMSNLMLKNNPRSDQKDHLDVLQFSARNLLNIVNDILDYNKIEAGKISFEKIEIDIPEILTKIISANKNSADEKRIELNLKIGDGMLPVMGDPTRLFQVINNLVSNAIKFTKTGEVKVSTTIEEKTDTTISIKFVVRDTGIGISEDKQKIIFDQFTQADSTTSRSYGGTGLGLAISKKIIALQGSNLELFSEEGKGSVFYFTQQFDIATIENKVITEVVEMPADTEIPLKGINILLVEDNQINIFVAQSFLEGWGANIDVAENGHEAINMLDIKKHHLVLMDLHMPVMDGYEAIKIMRQHGVKLPIIALTASLPSEIEEEVKDLGIDDMVLKPFVPEELFRKVVHYTLQNSTNNWEKNKSLL